MKIHCVTGELNRTASLRVWLKTASRPRCQRLRHKLRQPLVDSTVRTRGHDRGERATRGKRGPRATRSAGMMMRTRCSVAAWRGGVLSTPECELTGVTHEPQTLRLAQCNCPYDATTLCLLALFIRSAFLWTQNAYHKQKKRKFPIL